MKTLPCFTCTQIYSPKYISEVSVEGSCVLPLLIKKMLNYEKYISGIIKSGSCITLINKPLSITADNFFDTAYFSTYSKFVFWTFKQPFLSNLKKKINQYQVDDILCFTELLFENKAPFGDHLKDESEEVEFCVKKNADLRNDAGFNKMFDLDLSNRQQITTALLERKISLEAKVRKLYTLANILLY